MLDQLQGRRVSLDVVRFGFVGVVATLVYFLSAIYLRDHLYSPPILILNLIAYCLAMIVSYTGHYFWTYKAKSNHGTTIIKYIAGAIFGAALNGFIIYVSIYFSVEYRVAMLVAIVLVPTATYIINKKWVFES